MRIAYIFPIYFAQQTLSQFLEQVARRGSWIGGGGVAALSAALSAALLEKLVQSPRLTRRLRVIRRECVDLIEADARTFAGVIRAIREDDRPSFRRSLKAATEIPCRVVEHARLVQVACEAATRDVKPRFQSDLLCAMATARGAEESARALIRTNLAWLKDQRYAAQIHRRLRAAASHDRQPRP